jgi:hypothetical protein
MSEIDLWVNKFEKLRYEIVRGNDKYRKNYDLNQLKLEDQDEATILCIDEKIVSFSFLYYRNEKTFTWSNAARVLNRFWLSPKLRELRWSWNHSLLKLKISDLMIDAQIKKALTKNYEFVFISRHWPATNWQKHFLIKNTKWQGDENFMYKVANCKLSTCWQHCVWLPLKDNKYFPLQKIKLSDFRNELL